MASSVRDRVMPTIETYLQLTGVSAENLGRDAVNNSLCVPRLREGGKLLKDTADALLDRIISHLEALIPDDDMESGAEVMDWRQAARDLDKLSGSYGLSSTQMISTLTACWAAEAAAGITA